MQSAPALRAPVIPAAVIPDVVDDMEDQPELVTEVWRDAVRAHVLTRPAHAAALPRRLQRWAWLIALALHLILFLGLRLVREPLPVPDTNVMHVELVDMAQPEPMLPEPPSLPMRNAPRMKLKPPPASLPSARAAVTSRVAPPAVEEATPHFRIYNPDGSLNIPDDLIAQIDRAQPRPNFIPLKVEPSPLLQRRRMLKVRPNHFDRGRVKRGKGARSDHGSRIRRFIRAVDARALAERTAILVEDFSWRCSGRRLSSVVARRV
jgi:hypothetical protein